MNKPTTRIFAHFQYECGKCLAFNSMEISDLHQPLSSGQTYEKKDTQSGRCERCLTKHDFDFRIILNSKCAVFKREDSTYTTVCNVCGKTIHATAPAFVQPCPDCRKRRKVSGY